MRPNTAVKETPVSCFKPELDAKNRTTETG